MRPDDLQAFSSSLTWFGAWNLLQDDERADAVIRVISEKGVAALEKYLEQEER